MQESWFVLDLQVAAKVEDLKEFLEGRFGALPADLIQRIDALTDLNRVKQLVRAAGQVKGLEELPL